MKTIYKFNLVGKLCFPIFQFSILVLVSFFSTTNGFGQKTGENPYKFENRIPQKPTKTTTKAAPVKDQKSVKDISISNAMVFTNNVNFDYTGALQTFTVPCGVNQIYVTVLGAEGGTGAIGGNSASGGLGGKGSAVSGYLSVTPGQVLNIYVGGAGGTATGGYNGGGTGGSQNGGGGGGASDIRLLGTTAAHRIIVAGGGGGGGRAGCESVVVNGGAGGNGDGNGANGNNAPTSGGEAGGGAGAIGSNFGAKGIGCGGFLGQDGTAGTNLGIGGNGGNGQSCCCFSFASIPGGGGGGGGYFGGGGGGGGSAGTTGCSGNDKGAGGGGAGGSSFMGPLGLGKLLTGVRSGNGKVTISYDVNSILTNDTLTYVQPNCAVASSFTLIPAITISSSLANSDSSQTGRINRFAVVSNCSSAKAFPGTFTTTGSRFFKPFYFVNTSGSSQCFDIELSTNGVNLFFVTYLNKFDPGNLATNYLGDPGSSGNLTMSGQNVPSGDTLVVIVHEVNSGGGISIPFQLKIKGAKNLEYSANNGSTWQDSPTFSGLGAGDFITVARYVGSTCNSNLFKFQTSTTALNITTNYNNDLVLKLSTGAITATNKVLAPSEVFYTAGKSVALNPGFEAANGALFKASIGGCN